MPSSIPRAGPVPDKQTRSYLIGKDHQAIVGLAADGASDALGAVPQGVKGQKVVLADAELVAQVLEAGLVPAPSETTTTVASGLCQGPPPKVRARRRP